MLTEHSYREYVSQLEEIQRRNYCTSRLPPALDDAGDGSLAVALGGEKASWGDKAHSGRFWCMRVGKKVGNKVLGRTAGAGPTGGGCSAQSSGSGSMQKWSTKYSCTYM